MNDTSHILYLCINDGSDMRINKEVKTLSSRYSVTFLAIGRESDRSFVSKYCANVLFVTGSHKSPLVLLRFLFVLAKVLFANDFKAVHIVDEQLYLVVFVFLRNHKVILDVFDSMFLKWNCSKERMLWLKKILYSGVDRIIVTDENRRDLLPKFSIPKSVIIPNVPFSDVALSSVKKENVSPDVLTICYFGSLLKDRGSKFIFSLISSDARIKVICAGWLCDDYSKNLIKHPQVEYLGVLEQSQVNNILKKSGDYLLAIYPCTNLNNINASPNKLYDAIHCQTPLIMNSGVRVSAAVKAMNIGYIVDEGELSDSSNIISRLFAARGSYSFDDEMLSQYSWESYEGLLLSLY